MTESESICELQRHERIGVLIIDSPPVNALSTPVRQALLDAVATLNRDEALDALVIRCAGRTFFPGADLRELGEPPREPLLPDVVNAIEASAKPIAKSPSLRGCATALSAIACAPCAGAKAIR